MAAIVALSVIGLDSDAGCCAPTWMATAATRATAQLGPAALVIASSSIPENRPAGNHAGSLTESGCVDNDRSSAWLFRLHMDVARVIGYGRAMMSAGRREIWSSSLNVSRFL